MNIFCTGCSGFMGSVLVRHMLRNYPDCKITNYDALTYAGRGNNLADIEHDPRYRFIKGDIRNLDGLLAAIDSSDELVDVVLNYAAETHVDNSTREPLVAVETNVVGTANVLEAVRSRRIPLMIHISTDEVFGSIYKGKFRTDSPLLPNNIYAASKGGADLLCRAYFKTYGLPVIVTHSCNNVGPYQHPEKLFPKFITNILKSSRLTIHGSGVCRREYIYVYDHANAIDTIMHKGIPGEVYNIGTGIEKTNLEVTRAILSEMGKDERLIDYVEDRLGQDFRYAVDNEKVLALGWKATYDFAAIVRDTVTWYKQNKHWWEPLLKNNSTSEKA